MNLSGGGTSFSFGPRGASVSVGKRGVYGNVGIAGTGISMRSKLSDNGGSAPRKQQSQMVSVPATVGVRDDGEIYFQDQAGNPLPEQWAQIAKKQHADSIRQLIQSKCDEINAQIEAVGDLHLGTPAPQNRPVFVGREYGEQSPVEPTPKVPGFFAKFIASQRQKVEAENREAMHRHAEHLKAWEAEFAAHQQAEANRRRHIEVLIYTNPEAMEAHLEETLQDIAWPRETLVAAELLEGGRIVYIDVDLPEIEDMPNKMAGMPARGLKLSVKDMSATQVQRLYMKHIHSIGFRITGEAFAALPETQQVILSGYSQRRDKATGKIDDEYLYSVRVNRSAWHEIEFSKHGLKDIDVVESLARFDLRRTMSKTGVFKPITPFSVSDAKP